ncbi:amino acid ABC transporter substrate-binding protein [Methylobacterium pseudosasicola]|uniref:Amino acid ABC transporter substrate-binding protein, PAAT family n=1 Tax=Methylobacterium pseudosasicola TaxID=582667 RepID=A0A1I4PRB2_9HYPH|nr:amino acid ABC transporter substrate-binding protein [Methylobacterium pseudosasicola]SFM30298.1 amino acid ABC transporter substrate-binding protein, PAAT family [Methylobacterium pseudosasicola]
MRLLTTTLVLAILIAPATADPIDGTLKKIKDSNRIVLGVRDAATPFSYIDDKQNYVGFAVDICLKIADAVKRELTLPDLKVEMAPVISATRIPLMTNGTIDLECSATTNNVDRQRQVAFTNTHFLSAARFASKTAQGLVNIDDLKGRTVSAVAGSTNLLMLNKANTERKLGLNILSAKDVAEGFLLLENGRAAAFVLDDVQLSIAIAQAKEPGAYRISQEAFSEPEPYGIMLRKGDPAFKALVDRATADLYRSPEITALYDKWFLSPTPPRGINYNVPMSPELKHAYAHPTDNPDPASYVK